MLKIVEIHTAASPRNEYVVLQNQGVLSTNLHGWAIATDAWMNGTPSADRDLFVFTSDVVISPYTRVVLFLRDGEEGWSPTADGRDAYVVYWGRQERVWAGSTNLHLVHVTCSKALAEGSPALSTG